jgi:rhodanese-related sulfurtransferase
MFGFLRSAPAPRIDPAEAVRAVASGEALIVDVREPAEVQGSGKARGAVNLPLGRLPDLANPASGQHDKRLKAAKAGDLPIYVYCASGARSERAAAILRQHGHAQVIDLGHLGTWQAGGGAVVR